MRLTELEPSFVKIIDDKRHQLDVPLADADGIMFLCPKCFKDNGGAVGTHQIICWAPHVPQSRAPGPGRWNLTGTGYEDLTLVGGSSSIQLTGGCRWHGFVRKGEIVDA
jgi:hypothetical protein